MQFLYLDFLAPSLTLTLHSPPPPPPPPLLFPLQLVGRRPSRSPASHSIAETLTLTLTLTLNLPRKQRFHLKTEIEENGLCLNVLLLAPRVHRHVHWNHGGLFLWHNTNTQIYSTLTHDNNNAGFSWTLFQICCKFCASVYILNAAKAHLFWSTSQKFFRLYFCSQKNKKRKEKIQFNIESHPWRRTNDSDLYNWEDWFGDTRKG